MLYRGNGGHQSVNGVGFQPDLVWIKSRTSNHGFGFDVNRGIERLDTSATQEGRTNEGNIVISSDGFDITSSHPTTNNNDSEMVAWCWKAGGAAVANTDGSIAAQISVNQDAGFSILSYTGNGTSGTVGHGLGKTPNIVICKNRTDTSTNWSVNGNVAGLIYGTNKLILQQTVARVTIQMKLLVQMQLLLLWGIVVQQMILMMHRRLLLDRIPDLVSLELTPELAVLMEHL